MKTFRELIVWRKAHELVLKIYKITLSFPREERFGLISQIRRSSCSIATNIVEGFKRRGNKEFIRYLNISDASLEETKYHLILSQDLGHIKSADYQLLYGLCDEIGRMLSGLQKKLIEKKYGELYLLLMLITYHLILKWA